MAFAHYARRCAASRVGWLRILCFPAEASAQIVARSFEQLQSHVRPGDTIYVIDSSGMERCLWANLRNPSQRFFGERASRWPASPGTRLRRPTPCSGS